MDEAARKARLRASAAQSITLRDLSEQWLREFVIPKLKPRTQTDYRQLLAQHILPLLGNLSVTELDRRHIEQRHVAMAATPRRANWTTFARRSASRFKAAR